MYIFYGVYLIEVLSWPIVVLVIFWMIRHHISPILRSLKKVEGMGFSAEFQRDLEELRNAVDSLAETPSKYIFSSTTLKIFQLAEKSPKVAILSSWREVELRTLCITRPTTCLQSEP